MKTHDEEQTRRKKKRAQKGANTWLIVGIVAGIVLVVGVVVLIIVLNRGPGNDVQAKGKEPAAPVGQPVQGQPAPGQPAPGDDGLHLKPNPPPKGLVQNVRAASYRPMRLNELRQIATFFTTFELEQKRAPRTEAEFIQYIQREARDLAEAVKEKYYVLNLKVNMREGSSIVAYEALTDAGGHQTARVDCSVAPVPPDELRKLLMP